MNREERVAFPTAQSILDRMHAVVSGIQRSSLYGNLNVTEGVSELSSVLRNLERLEGQLPDEQLKEAISSVSHLKDSVANRSTQNPVASQPRFEVTTPRDSNPGRNKLAIDMEHLQRLIQLGFSVSKIAKDGLLGGIVHPNTLYQRLKQNDTPVRSKYCNITDEDLTVIIKDYNQNYPNSGAEEVCAFFKSQGLIIQRSKCRQILSQVDAVGTVRRWSRTIQRRQYSVPMANSLWHMDTHHSLVRWKIVVHGAIDGKSRLIPYLRAASCNTARASAYFFMNSVRKYGVPSRVRADHGTEFSDTEKCMNLLRGEGRGSFIKGKSVHNQRIERLWRDVFIKVLHQYYQLFNYLEDQQLLDPADEIQMFCLQHVFVGRIDEKLRHWQHTHNSHRIRTAGNLTPEMIWLESMIHSDETATANQQIPDLVDQCFNDFDLNCDEYEFLRPRMPCPLSDEQLTSLKTTISVTRDSDSDGLDIYRDVLNFVAQHNPR